MEKGFKFSSEQIIYIYLHFAEYIDTVKSQLEKNLKVSQGQLELLEKVYGKEESFDRESHDLYSKLLNEEMPEMIEKRMNFIEGIAEIFKPSYELILEVDPDFIKKVEKELISDSDSVKELVEQIKKKEEGNDNY